MKKLQFIILLFFSSFLLSQSWSQDNNYFNNPNRGVYDELARKKEQEINRDMGNIRRVVNQTGNIATQLQENETTQNAGPGAPGEPIPSGGPGAPGEPVPIDKYKSLLFLLALTLIISNKEIMEFGRENKSCKKI